jgi:hypothetical protein
MRRAERAAKLLMRGIIGRFSWCRSAFDAPCEGFREAYRVRKADANGNITAIGYRFQNK